MPEEARAPERVVYCPSGQWRFVFSLVERIVEGHDMSESGVCCHSPERGNCRARCVLLYAGLAADTWSLISHSSSGTPSGGR